jgi:uroporphyrinogen-III decarboxylase
MLTNRQRLIRYVKDGGEPFCSPQIGAGAGFDAKMAGKEWLSEVTLEDTSRVCGMFSMIPLLNAGLPDLTMLTPEFQWQLKREYMDDRGRRRRKMEFATPHGNLATESIEERSTGVVQTKYPITDEAELSILEYFLDTLLEVTDYSPISEGVRDIRKMVGEETALDIQWSMQPYELLCFPNTMDTAIFALECPEQFRRLMDKILRLDEKLLAAVAEGGSDFVFLGGPGSEMISPTFYENFIVPYSNIVSEMAHKNGLLIYTHICSPIEPMLTMGYYNQMGIDLFETLSEAPVGNVKGIEDAFSKLDPKICTRGNIGLDLLLQGTPKEIEEASLRILETSRRMGRKHILAASDYLFYGTPPENVQAMCQAVQSFNECEQ